MILENIMVQKLKLENNVLYKKWLSKLLSSFPLNLTKKFDFESKIWSFAELQYFNNYQIRSMLLSFQLFVLEKKQQLWNPKTCQDFTIWETR